MIYDFYCRPSRFFKQDNFECWSMETDSGEGFSAEDVVVIQFENCIKALLLSSDSSRLNSEYYRSYILDLFEHIIEDGNDFDLKEIFDADVDEYDITKLIDIHQKSFE